MDDFESIVEEYDNNYEEADVAVPSKKEQFDYDEVLLIEKIN